MIHSKSTLKLTSSYAHKYPKFLLLFITFLVAYLLFSGRTNPKLHVIIISLGFFGTFLTGILFTYGFTAAPATAIFLILAKEQNIVLAASKSISSKVFSVISSALNTAGILVVLAIGSAL